MNALLQAFLTIIPIYKYGLLFLLVMIEGPLITMGAGWLGSLGYLNLVLATVIIICADMLSDCAYYAAGYFGGEKLVKKYTSTSLSRLRGREHFIHRHSRKAIVLAKLTHVAGVPFLLTAGLSRIPFSIFFLYDFVATIPKSIIFVALGFYVSHIASTINQYLEYGTFGVFALLLVIFIGYSFLGKYVRAKFG